MAINQSLINMNQRNTKFVYGEGWLRVLASYLLAVCLLNSIANAQQRSPMRVLTESYTMREDFQGDSLGQWASYPPPQDIGYEPSLSPTSDYDAPGGRSLMRIIKPNRAGPQRFGFIKQLRLLTSADAQLSFSYRLNAAGRGDRLEIGLAAADGRRYTTLIPVTTSGWTEARVRLSALRAVDGRSPAINVGIEAIYIVARVERADPDTTYRFLLDQVTLAAERATRFDVRTPQAISIEPWATLMSGKGYRHGEVISFEAGAPVKLTSVECLLKTGDGRAITTQPLYDDGSHGDRSAGDGVWTNSAVYAPGGSDPTGVWIAQLSGKTPGGGVITTPVRFIVHPSKTSGHPRLYFGATDREALIVRTRNPKVAPLWAKLQATAQKTREAGSDLSRANDAFSRLDDKYLLPTLLGYFGILNEARARIASNALDAYITGNSDARSAAKSALLTVARWQRWEPPWFTAHGQHTYYPAGQLATEVAFGYDLLYADLSEAERSLVRRALIERSIIPTYKEYVLDNRVMANTSNWISHTVAGALIAAAAIAGDVRDAESGGRFELYLNGLLQKIEDHMAASFLPDGSYGEGISYHEFDLETLSLTLPALERVFGINYWKSTHVLNSFAYPVYTLAQPTSQSLDMGDSHPPSGRTIASFVKQSRDPLMSWYYQQFAHHEIRDFLFFDDSIPARPPQLPPSRIFTDKGNAVFRTGWGKDDLLMLFRAGPNYNHNHADQGSFLLNAYGENLVTEAGWSDYYKDPYYATFFTQAIGHNTVLVDNNPESQILPDNRQFAALNAYPRITDAVTGEFYDSVGSDLVSVYADRLERYTRRIIFIKPHYLVIYDDLEAKGEPAVFDWLLHLPDRARIKTTGLRAYYEGRKAALAVRAFAPEGAQIEARNGHLPYPVFSTTTPREIPPQPAFLDLGTTVKARRAQFLVALIPARSLAEAEAREARMSRLSGDGWIGIHAVRDSESDFIIFRAGSTSGTWRYEDWSTDAAALTITKAGERLRLLALQQASTLKRADRILFTSDRMLSLVLDYSENGIGLTARADGQTKMSLYTGTLPTSARINGRELAKSDFSFDSAQGRVSFTLPAGQHDVIITLR